MEFLTGWLAQPMANWAKHTGFCSEEGRSFSEVCEIRYNPCCRAGAGPRLKDAVSVEPYYNGLS